jgi:hypothetical protein
MESGYKPEVGNEKQLSHLQHQARQQASYAFLDYRDDTFEH